MALREHNRCTAVFKHLDDDENAIDRSKEHRRLVLEAYDDRQARKSYGIISSVVVSRKDVTIPEFFKLIIYFNNSRLQKGIQMRTYPS